MLTWVMCIVWVTMFSTVLVANSVAVLLIVLQANRLGKILCRQVDRCAYSTLVSVWTSVTGLV